MILYFYPKDDTPGCTKEACSFRDNYSPLRDRGAQILGVSRDGTESHQNFAKKYSLPFPLLSDPQAEVSKQYGVYKLRVKDGVESFGVERSTFIIDKNGLLKRIFRGVQVDGHTAELLDALDNLGA